MTKAAPQDRAPVMVLHQDDEHRFDPVDVVSRRVRNLDGHGLVRRPAVNAALFQSKSAARVSFYTTRRTARHRAGVLPRAHGKCPAGRGFDVLPPREITAAVKA